MAFYNGADDYDRNCCECVLDYGPRNLMPIAFTIHQINVLEMEFHKFKQQPGEDERRRIGQFAGLKPIAVEVWFAHRLHNHRQFEEKHQQKQHAFMEKQFKIRTDVAIGRLEYANDKYAAELTAKNDENTRLYQEKTELMEKLKQVDSDHIRALKQRNEECQMKIDAFHQNRQRLLERIIEMENEMESMNQNLTETARQLQDEIFYNDQLQSQHKGMRFEIVQLKKKNKECMYGLEILNEELRNVIVEKNALQSEINRQSNATDQLKTKLEFTQKHLVEFRLVFKEQYTANISLSEQVNLLTKQSQEEKDHNKKIQDDMQKAMEQMETELISWQSRRSNCKCLEMGKAITPEMLDELYEIEIVQLNHSAENASTSDEDALSDDGLKSAENDDDSISVHSWAETNCFSLSHAAELTESSRQSGTESDNESEYSIISDEAEDDKA